MESFRSKVDAWFVGVVILVGLVTASTLVAAAREGMLLPALVLLPAFGVVLWIWIGTRYIVSERELIVRSAFLRKRVPLADIRQVRRTATVLSAPALSLDRLEIQHVSGTVTISPADRGRFLETLAARAPAAVIDVRPGGADADTIALRRTRRDAILAVATSSAGAFAAVAALSLWQGSPPEVAIAADQLTLRSGGTRLSIPFRDVRAVRLLEALPPLRKRVGWNSGVLLRGRFTSDGQSGYVHVSPRTPPFVRLDTADGFVLVNYPDEAETHALYEDVRARLGG